ncbi:MAG: hypothetical protein AB7U20_17460, partial [Planctomycetaceae bacterium]
LLPEKQAVLERRAAAAGQDIESYILAVVHQSLEAEPDGAAKLPYSQWQRDFDAWVTGHKSHNPNFDDSRETIYD